MTDSIKIDIEKIMQMIPHRYPMLLIDRMLEINGNQSAVGLKNVTINEPFFQGHFPDKPVMPGVLIIEAMAQTAAILVVENMQEQTNDKIVYFMAIDKAKFRRPIIPGDSVHIYVEKQHERGKVWRFACRAEVDGKLCAEAIVTAMIADK